MTLDEAIIAEEIESGGLEGESALSLLPAGYEGVCAMRFYNKHGGYWVKFPSRKEAITAASGGCRRDVGGYTCVSVHPANAAPIDAPLYPSALHWLFEGMEVFTDEEQSEVTTVSIVRQFLKQLARQIAQKPAVLAEVEWRDLERVLGEVFEGLGFDTTVTRSGKDGSYDLRLEADGDEYLVELKHWSEPSKVGASAITHFAEVAVAKNAKGMLISTSGFTAQALKGRLQIAERSVVLGDKLKVISLCQYYFRSQMGVWTNEGNLKDIFFEHSF